MDDPRVYAPTDRLDPPVNPRLCKAEVGEGSLPHRRQCQALVWKDGWCYQHHPDTLARRRAKRDTDTLRDAQIRGVVDNPDKQTGINLAVLQLLGVLAAENDEWTAPCGMDDWDNIRACQLLPAGRCIYMPDCVAMVARRDHKVELLALLNELVG